MNRERNMNLDLIAALEKDMQNPQWAEWAIGQYVFFNDLEVEEDKIYQIEYIKPMTQPRKKNDPKFRRPTQGQLEAVRRMVKVAFPKSEQFQEFVIRLAEEVYDVERVSELINNIGRITNEITEGQKNLLREYWQEERFPQLRKYIKENELWKKGKKEVSDELTKLKRAKDQLESLYLPQSKYDKLNGLYKRATGRTFEMDFPNPADRADFVNNETYDGLYRTLKEYLKVDQFYHNRPTEYEERIEWVTEWNDADFDRDVEDMRRETGTGPLDPYKFNKQNEDRIARNQKYGARNRKPEVVEEQQDFEDQIESIFKEVFKK